MDRRKLGRPLIGLLILAVVALWLGQMAGRPAEPDTVELLSREEAQARALEQTKGGTVIRCEQYYREEEKTWVYEIQILDQRKQTKMEVDAVTGAVRASTSTDITDKETVTIESEIPAS